MRALLGIYLCLAAGTAWAADEVKPLWVMIDPGHGPAEPGVEAGQFREEALVFEIAQMLQERLKEAGLHSQLSRDAHSTPSAATRAARANASRARAFISLHLNHSHSPLVRGPRVFVPKAYPEAAASEPRRWERAAGQRSTQARDLAGEFSKILARAESARVTVQSLNLAPFKGLDMPAVLIELGFLSHVESRERLLDPAYRRQMASSLAEAVLAWHGRQAHARAEGEP